MALSTSAVRNGSLLLLAIVASAFAMPSLHENRIIGGSESTIELFPFQLGLEGGGPTGGRHICGGSVLARDWALTAAHCVYDKPTKSLTFRAGSATRGSGGSLHPVHYYLYPDQYQRQTLDYDIAVVRVKVPFHYGPTVSPIVLPVLAPRQGEAVDVSGWGFLEKEQLRKPKELMFASVNIINWDKCKKIYPSLTPRMMCAGAKAVDFCSGDSGGPLTRNNMEQVGVVSWLYKCGDGLPGVYTNITTLVSWITASAGLQNVMNNPEGEGSFPSREDIISFPED